MPIVLSGEWDLAAIYRLVWVLKSVLVKLFILWIFKATGETAIKRYLFDLNERWTGLKAHFELSLWIKTAIMCDECVCCAYACAYCCCYECFFSLNFHSLLMLMVMLWNGVPFINHTCEYIIRTMVWHAFHFICFALLLWFPFSLSLFCHLFNFKSNQIVFLHIHKPATSSPTHSLNFERWCIFSLFKSSIFPSFITHFESNIINDSAKNAADRHTALYGFVHLILYRKKYRIFIVSSFWNHLLSLVFSRVFIARHFLHSSCGLCANS